MKISEGDPDEGCSQKVERKREKTKEEILDETFRKAELSKKTRPEIKEEQKAEKKPFIKSGIVLIIIAILGLAIINYLPWMYIKYDTDYGTIEEYFSYKDFENKEIEPNEIESLFESTCNNCSNNSQSYIGLTINDFTNTPKIISYGFIALALAGFIFTMFIIIDRVWDFSKEIVTIIHSIFASTMVIASIVILLSAIKFLGVHLLFHINRPFIEVLGLNNINLFFFMPFILIFFSSALMIIGLTIIKINLNKAVKKLEGDKSEKPYSTYRYGSKL